MGEESLAEAGATDVRLFGRSPQQRAFIDMWNRRIEFELLAAVGKAWIHGPVLKDLRKARGIIGHESELQLGLASAQSFLREVDRELASHGPYVAGADYSIADVTLLCVIDFAAGPVFVPVR